MSVAKGERIVKRVLAPILLATLRMVQVSGSVLGFGGLYVNGESIYTQINLVEENGRTLVPVRVIAGRLGCTVDGDETGGGLISETDMEDAEYKTM